MDDPGKRRRADWQHNGNKCVPQRRRHHRTRCHKPHRSRHDLQTGHCRRYKTHFFSTIICRPRRPAERFRQTICLPSTCHTNAHTQIIIQSNQEERMKKEKVSPAAIALISVVAAAFTFASCTQQTPAPKGYHLVWSDEFSAKKIDTTKWDFQTGTGSQYGLTDWGNNELEYYAPENAFIEKGNLVLEARKEDKEGKQYTSARLRTMKEDGTALFSKTYGRIEARIKLPKGNGIWPAFWLLPATSDYGVWASSGEIDILEAKGRLSNRIYGTVHYGQAWPGNKNSGGMYKFPDGQDIGGYHTYALEWEPGKLTWLVDDNKFYETRQR